MSESWIWGFHSIEGALAQCPEIVLEVCIEKGHRRDWSKGLERLLRESGVKVRELGSLPRVNADARTQGIVAKLKHFPTDSWNQVRDDFRARFEDPKPGQWVLLDRIQDPRNFGAILRSAAAFGVEAAFVGLREQAPLTGVVAATSAGNLFRMPIVDVQNLKHVAELARECGVEVLALDMDGENISKAMSSLSQAKMLWIVGSEGKGVRPGLLESCSRTLCIPMAEDVESLNASTAATVAFYAAAQAMRSVG